MRGRVISCQAVASNSNVGFSYCKKRIAKKEDTWAFKSVTTPMNASLVLKNIFHIPSN